MITPFEQAVLDMMLEEANEPYITIRSQLAQAQVAQREFTGAGFFTHFSLSEDASVKRDLPDMALGHVGAEMPGLLHGAGFVLFIRNGIISTLEGFSYDEPWPEVVNGFKLFRIKNVGDRKVRAP